MQINQVFIGTSGFYLQNFYPKDLIETKLDFYAKVFPTVQIIMFPEKQQLRIGYN